jgi:ribosomal protein S18 acetylase RimI-like enzyme
VRTNAGRYESWPALVELDKAAFVEHLDGLMDVYATAMKVPAFQLPGRRAVMDAHVLNPAFRAVAVTGPASNVLGGAGGTRDGRTGQAVVAFAYGFHGRRGQWWHDLVRSALTVASGTGGAAAWLDDSFEVAEVHVRPEYQKRGIGRRMLYRLTGGLPERTAVLSTMDDDTPARHLYRSLGFTDLLTGYQFAGVAESYAVMGAALPLLSAGPGGADPPAARPPSPRY